MNEKADRATVIPMPLFQQVKEDIRNKILQGVYAPHEKLPSEREMTAAFSVSRITIRQALSELQREGLIFKINGKGTFVSQPKAQFDVSTLRGFGESAASIGQEAFSKLISIATEASSETVATHLQLQVGSPVTKIQRLRYLNRAPIAFDITYAAASLGELITNADLQKRDIFDVLENDCGISVKSAQLNVEALLCEEDLADHLNIEPLSAILHIERKIEDATDKPILYENIYYRGDCFRFGLNIHRAQITGKGGF